jgi:hypothetical protein
LTMTGGASEEFATSPRCSMTLQRAPIREAGLGRHGAGNPWTRGREIGGRLQEGLTLERSGPGLATVRWAARIGTRGRFCCARRDS